MYLFNYITLKICALNWILKGKKAKSQLFGSILLLKMKYFSCTLKYVNYLVFKVSVSIKYPTIFQVSVPVLYNIISKGIQPYPHTPNIMARNIANCTKTSETIVLIVVVDFNPDFSGICVWFVWWVMHIVTISHNLPSRGTHLLMNYDAIPGLCPIVCLPHVNRGRSWWKLKHLLSACAETIL